MARKGSIRRFLNKPVGPFRVYFVLLLLLVFYMSTFPQAQDQLEPFTVLFSSVDAAITGSGNGFDETGQYYATPIWGHTSCDLAEVYSPPATVLEDTNTGSAYWCTSNRFPDVNQKTIGPTCTYDFTITELSPTNDIDFIVCDDIVDFDEQRSSKCEVKHTLNCRQANILADECNLNNAQTAMYSIAIIPNQTLIVAERPDSFPFRGRSTINAKLNSGLYQLNVETSDGRLTRTWGCELGTETEIANAVAQEKGSSISSILKNGLAKIQGVDVPTRTDSEGIEYLEFNAVQNWVGGSTISLKSANIISGDIVGLSGQEIYVIDAGWYYPEARENGQPVIYNNAKVFAANPEFNNNIQCKPELPSCDKGILKSFTQVDKECGIGLAVEPGPVYSSTDQSKQCFQECGIDGLINEINCRDITVCDVLAGQRLDFASNTCIDVSAKPPSEITVTAPGLSGIYNFGVKDDMGNKFKAFFFWIKLIVLGTLTIGIGKFLIGPITGSRRKVTITNLKGELNPELPENKKKFRKKFRFAS